MNKAFFLLILAFGIIACNKSTNNSVQPITPPQVATLNPNFIRGVDLSFTPEILLAGTQFKDNNQTKDLIQIFKESIQFVFVSGIRRWMHIQAYKRLLILQKF